MTRTATQGLLMIGGFVVLLFVTSMLFVNANGNGVRGAAIGAGLGIVNLGVGFVLTRRSLRQGMRSAMATLLGSFLARAVILVALILAFERTTTVDAAAFALTFLVFFFVLLGVELLMVERARSGVRSAPSGGSATGSAA